MRNRALYLSLEDLTEAAHAWRSGGSLALGAWAVRHMPHFTVAEYGALVREVRDYLGDDTDYSGACPVLAARTQRGAGETQKETR